jgi:hypothetical protein
MINKTHRAPAMALATLAAIGITLAARAALPTFSSKSAAGNAAAPSRVIFPADPNSQIRLLSVLYSSDTNNAQLQFTTGGTPLLCLATNSASGVTQVVASTLGIPASSILVLQHAGVCYPGTLSSTNNSTNVVLTSGGFGQIASIGDEIFVMGATNNWIVGVGTNALQGEAIYVGNYGRPVMIYLTPALSTNQLNGVTAHYDSQSQ